MLRHPCAERPDWQATAETFGFHFHTLYGEPYWDESAYYQFSLKQVEQDLEDPTAELHQMCLEVVDRVIRDERLLQRFCIPAEFHDAIAQDWYARSPSLYSRLDLAYDGTGPAKLLENNADTPTSLYETGFWQWLWLEQQVNRGLINHRADQFNALQERLIARFAALGARYPGRELHVSCCRDTVEDRGTVQYLQDCAEQAGITTRFIHVEEIGLTSTGGFADLDRRSIQWLFKLYPW
ncbi:glutathionylspermidine synthase family protein, partial [Stutzerimonas frequens]|uniref:glutathionylspermidine synthase family protein n=1 Tax=Stutzerimonas frequens TaxID=2968969 RepID=UPI0022DE6AAE